MSSYRPGDLVLIEIPFTDLTGRKKRPAFVVTTQGQDCLVAFITSRIEQAAAGDFVLRKSSGNGLAVDSAVLLHKLFTLHASLIVRKLGACSTTDRRAVIQGIVSRISKGL
jgi:mRNA interferase MazF